jgi:hypothetical protein
MKLCKDCKFYKQGTMENMIVPLCNDSICINPFAKQHPESYRSDYYFCSTMRMPIGPCGPLGNLFEEK